MLEKLNPNKEIPSVRTVKYVAYLIRNRYSPKVYVGSTSNPGRRTSSHRSNLKRGVHENINLQNLYNESQHVDFVFYEVSNREKAYELEKALIDHFNKLGLLLNIQLDPVNNTLTKEQLEKFRARSEEYSRKQSKPVSIDGIVYESIREASRKLNLAKSSVASRIHSKKLKYANWHYVGKPKKDYNTNNYSTNTETIKIGDKEYSFLDYEKLTGISRGTLFWRRRLGITDENLHLPVKHKRKKMR